MKWAKRAVAFRAQPLFSIQARPPRRCRQSPRIPTFEGAVKLGYFHNGHFPPIEFEEFVRWGAANGYQAIDVPLFQPDARAICERHGLEPTSTTGMICQPIATDAEARAEQAAEARRALDYAAAEHIPLAWLGHQMAPDLGFDANVRLFAEGVAPVLDHAQRVGVRLVMENWADGGRNLAYAPAHWEAIFDAVPHEALGLCFDPSHLFGWASTISARRGSSARASTRRTPRTPSSCPRRATGSASLAPSAGGSARERYRFRIPGFGVIDWPAFITALLDVGYVGPLVVEHEDPFWSARTDPENDALKGLVLAQRFLAPLLV